MRVAPMSQARRDQWTRRLNTLQALSGALVRQGDFAEAARALRVSRRAYEAWGRECFAAPTPGGAHPNGIIEHIPAEPQPFTRDLANAFRL